MGVSQGPWGSCSPSEGVEGSRGLVKKDLPQEQGLGLPGVLWQRRWVCVCRGVRSCVQRCV